MNSEWQEILNKVQSGELTAEEGARLLQRLEGQSGTAELPQESGGVASEPVVADAVVEKPAWVMPAAEFAVPQEPDPLSHWRRWWLIPFWAGVGIFLLAAILMAWGYTNERFFWFYCAWLPLLLGLLALVLSAWSRTARWVHIRIQNHGSRDSGDRPQRIAISFPIPVRLAGWFLRVFGPLIPPLKDKNLESIGPILESLGTNHDPLVVEVNEKDGEKVQVYIV